MRKIIQEHKVEYYCDATGKNFIPGDKDEAKLSFYLYSPPKNYEINEWL